MAGVHFIHSVETGMFLDIAKPLTFFSCILMLGWAFSSAFLDSSLDLDQKIYRSVARLILAGVISVVSGLIFQSANRREQHGHDVRLRTTLPLQLFFWASSLMCVLFVVSWYLEHCCRLIQFAHRG